MKINAFALILISMSLFLFSCDCFNDENVMPSDKVTTEQYTFSDYDMIDASSAFTVYLSFSENEESIEIEANDNLHQYLDIKNENNTLNIGFKNNFNVRGSATLNAYVKTKNISGYIASGASRFIVENPIEGDEISIYLSGASNFSSSLSTNRMFADLSGASDMQVSGTVNSLEIEASGASLVRDYGFETKSLIADLSGASNMQLTVKEEISIEASGASSLKYKGDAVITQQDLSGASTVRKMN